MSEWVKVSDRLPPEEYEALLFCGWVLIGFQVDSVFYTDDGVNQVFQVSHWMPLPEPPEIS